MAATNRRDAARHNGAELAPIEAGVSYPLTVFQRHTGLGRHAMRMLRRDGLRVRYVSGRAFVLGDDWLQFLADRDTG